MTLGHRIPVTSSLKACTPLRVFSVFRIRGGLMRQEPREFEAGQEWTCTFLLILDALTGCCLRSEWCCLGQFCPLKRNWETLEALQ